MIMLDGSFDLPFPLQGNTQVVVRLFIVRLDLQGSMELLNGSFSLPLPLQGNTQVVVRLRVIRLDL